MIRRIRLAVLASLALTCTAGWADSGSPLKLPSPASWNESPAIAAAADGTIWLAWTAFRAGDDNVVVARTQDGIPTVVTELGDEAQADVAPRICVGSDGDVHVVWTGRREAGFRVLHRHFSEGVWSEETVISSGLDKCLDPVMAASNDGKVYVAWEAIADGNSDIYSATWDDGRWSQPARLTYSAEADCNPSLAVDETGKAWIAWDRCQDAGYRIHFASFSGDAVLGEQTIDFGQGHFQHPELAAAEGRVWVACVGFRPLGELRTRSLLHLDVWYNYLPVHQTVKAWDGLRWSDPPADPENAFGFAACPVVDSDGDLWVFYQVPAEKKYRPRAKVLGGGRWRAALEVSGDLLSWKHRPAACVAGDAVWAAFPSNTREGSSRYAFTIEPGESHIYLVRLDKPTAPAPTVEQEFPPPSPLTRDPEAPIRAIDHDGETLNLYFGDLHKHSDISGCGRLDGTTTDNHRFWRDWRQLDFMMNSDHAEHHDDYDWAKVRRAASLFTDERYFAAYSGYEWTSEFEALGNLRCGHYNPTFLGDGDNLPCLSASKPESNDPDKLWARLKESLRPGDDVITVCHHSGRENAPMQWEYYDPELATHIEVVQARGSYEHWNCPDPQRRYNDTTRTRGYFVQDGLARGYTYGFTGGGDHSGRAITGVFAPSGTKADIFRALKAKRCYATNGEKIFLDFRVDQRLMGSDFESPLDAHTITVHAAAPSRITRIDLWRDGQVVQSAEPMANEWRRGWKDDSGWFRRTYYYARVMTEAGGIAWASPIWITHTRAKGGVRVYIDSQQAELMAPPLACELPVVLRNDGQEDATVTLTFDLPRGWELEAKPSATTTIGPGAWAELTAVIIPTGPPDGEPRLQTVRARLEPAGSAVEACEILVLNMSAAVEDAARARELCVALLQLPPGQRDEYLRQQTWLRESMLRFAHANAVAWQSSRVVPDTDTPAVDEAVTKAGADASRLPDLDWTIRAGQLYLDDDNNLSHSVALVDLRPEDEPKAGQSYCITYVHSPEARDVNLRVGTDGQCVMWVNGAPVEGIARRGAKRSAVEAGARLRAGWNQLALRIARGGRFTRFWMKVISPEGEPFDDLRFAVRPDVGVERP